ncbi:hypothetical protein M501DRAFT_1012580 [Patellaria atrata CBS 101060]|uniref:Uncharacterized protein n=1 Tax=Patellaria atrata CBS 101060 TaxID=1346257 RepID=A0A9P4VRR2_9PEZI|nr:hypothetical protein M501DRAFT_1012580 [Patellaria atrata CBS 101060]
MAPPRPEVPSKLHRWWQAEDGIHPDVLRNSIKLRLGKTAKIVEHYTGNPRGYWIESDRHYFTKDEIEDLQRDSIRLWPQRSGRVPHEDSPTFQDRNSHSDPRAGTRAGTRPPPQDYSPVPSQAPHRAGPRTASQANSQANPWPEVRSSRVDYPAGAPAEHSWSEPPRRPETQLDPRAPPSYTGYHLPTASTPTYTQPPQTSYSQHSIPYGQQGYTHAQPAHAQPPHVQPPYSQPQHHQQAYLDQYGQPGYTTSRSESQPAYSAPSRTDSQPGYRQSGIEGQPGYVQQQQPRTTPSYGYPDIQDAPPYPQQGHYSHYAQSASREPVYSPPAVAQPPPRNTQVYYTTDGRAVQFAPSPGDPRSRH